MSQSQQPVEENIEHQSKHLNYDSENSDSLLDKSSHVMDLINDGVLVNYCTAPPGSKEWSDYQIQRVVAMRKLKIKNVEFQAKANQDLRKLMGDVIEDPHIPELIDSNEDLPLPMGNETPKKTRRQQTAVQSKDLNANVTWKEPIADTRVMSLHVITQAPSKPDPHMYSTKGTVLKLKNGRKNRAKILPTAISKTSGKMTSLRNTISTGAKSSKTKSKMQVIGGNTIDIAKIISDVTGRNSRSQETELQNKAKTINTFVSTLKTLKTKPTLERSRKPSMKAFPLLEAFTDISLDDDEYLFRNKSQQPPLENGNYANLEQVQEQQPENFSHKQESKIEAVGFMQYGDIMQDQVELGRLLPTLPDDIRDKNKTGKLSNTYTRSINNTMADGTKEAIKSPLFPSAILTTYARFAAQMQTKKVDDLSLSPVESNASESNCSVAMEDYSGNDDIATQLPASNINIANRNGFSGATSTASVSRWENFQSRAKYLTMEYEALEELLARIKPPELPEFEVCDAVPGTARWQTYWADFNNKIGDYYSSVEKYSKQMDGLLIDEDGKQYTDDLRKRYCNETALKASMGLPRRPPLIRQPLRETIDIGGYIIRPLGGPILGAFVTSYDHMAFRLEIQVDKFDNELDNITTDAQLNIMTITIPSNCKGSLFKKLIQITVPKYKKVQSLRIGNPLYNAGKIIVTGV